MEQLTKYELDLIRYSLTKLGPSINPESKKQVMALKIKISKRLDEIEKQEKQAEFDKLRLSMEVGMGATMHGWSDSHAGTIVSFNEKKTSFTVQRDEATIINAKDLQVYPGGFAAHVEGQQKYSYKRDKTGSRHTFTLRKNGRFVEKGCSMGTGYRVTIGIRNEHYDYNF